MTQWEVVARISLALGFVSAGIIAIDIALGRRQMMAVMNLVWPITALYSGPLGLAAYFFVGRAMPMMAHDGPMHHQMPAKPFWQRVLISTTHCGAGCTVGDVISEMLLFGGSFRLEDSALLTRYVSDYVLAYVFGVGFQLAAILPMGRLSFSEALAQSIKADTLSLTAFEVGMFAFMGFAMHSIFTAPLSADEPLFWFVMQLAMIAGFATSYPANWWLVRKGIKEGM
jgi:hypothetical protein